MTHANANKYNFPGEEVELEVEGIAGINHVISTTIYTVTVFDLKVRKHDYQCYGLVKIASADVQDPHSYRKIFSQWGLKPSDVKKPRNIDLLISLRAAAQHPNKVMNIGHMTLYDGIFGKVLGGTDPDLTCPPCLLW